MSFMQSRRVADVVRVLLLIVASGMALWWFDVANAVVFQASLIGVFVVGMSHVTRRILFPNLDLQAIALKAIADQNWPAAIIFCAVVFFLVEVMTLSMRVFK